MEFFGQNEEVFADTVIAERKPETFYDVEVLGKYVQTIMNSDGEKFATVRSVCEAIGVDFNGQRKKLNKDPNFSCRLKSTTGRDGKNYDMMCIPIDRLEGWLITINPNRLDNDEVAQNLFEFRERSIRVLYEFWNTGISVAGEDDIQVRDSLIRFKTDSEFLAVKNASLAKENGDLKEKVQKLRDGNGWPYAKSLEKKLEAQGNAIQESLNERQRTIDEQAKKIADNAELIKKLSKQINDGNVAYAAINEEVEKLRAEATTIEEKDAKIQSLEEELGDLKPQVNIYKMHIDSQHKDIAEKKKDVNHYRRQKRRLEVQVDSLSKMNREYSIQIEKLREKEYGPIPEEPLQA